MEFVCDAPRGRSWFRIETEGEAARESAAMNHTVEKYFRREREKAVQSYKPASQNSIERDIGLNAHLARTMPVFVTLRDREGIALATGMLPPQAQSQPGFRIIIVGPSNADPYPAEGDAIETLAAHYGIALPRDTCFPYRSYGV